VSDTSCHFILAMRVGRGPRPDVDEFRPLVKDALRAMSLLRMVADAGYDSEPNHRFARERCGIRTIIPAKHGRPTTKPAPPPSPPLATIHSTFVFRLRAVGFV